VHTFHFTSAVVKFSSPSVKAHFFSSTGHPFKHTVVKTVRHERDTVYQYESHSNSVVFSEIIEYNPATQFALALLALPYWTRTNA
jgi:hypothetical protein